MKKWFTRKISKIRSYLPSLRYFGSARRRLQIRGRPKLPVSEFKVTDKLYRSFDQDGYDFEEERIIPESIRFPDLSCNWSRFSLPSDVRLRPSGDITDGCYSFTVEIARFNNFANPVHAPEKTGLYENYSHVEVPSAPDRRRSRRGTTSV